MYSTVANKIRYAIAGNFKLFLQFPYHTLLEEREGEGNLDRQRGGVRGVGRQGGQEGAGDT